VGRTPQKPSSGKFMVRVTPEIHAHAATMAEARGMSLNAWAAQALALYR
jgi:predicted HicB family RNase H-like nuclease